MKFLHKSSPECTSSELDIFMVPATQSSILSARWVELSNENNTLDGETPIRFVIPATGENYTDLANTYLYLQVEITNKNANVTDKIALGPVNNFMHSMFSQVEVSLGDTLITPQTNLYPYRAMVETLLNYSEDSKKSYLTSAMYYQDKAGVMDSILLDGTGIDVKTLNSGW